MTTESHTVVIAEDHAIVREGLRELLTTELRCEVVCEAEDGRGAVRCVQKHEPDLILLDLSMPKSNGMEAIREIRKLGVKTRIIVLTIHKNEDYVLATLESGTDGYLLKDCSFSELKVAISHVMKGNRYISPFVSDKVIEGFIEVNNVIREPSLWDSLTQREREVLKLVAEGYRSKEIADFLCISVKTVEKHRSNIMEKLKLHNVAALTAFAIEKGLVSP